MKYFSVISPFLYALAFLLITLQEVSLLVSPIQLFRPLLILWFLLLLLLYPAYLFASDWELAGFLLSVCLFGIAFSARFLKLAGLLLIIVLVVWQVYFRIRGIKLTFKQFASLSTMTSIALVIYSLSLNILPLAQVPWSKYFQAVERAQSPPFNSRQSVEQKPDIYYIVLDGYARADILQELYGYDNSGFIEHLQEQGFIVPSQAHSNYAKTVVSVSSTLNLDYQDSFAPGLNDSYYWWLMEPFIDHSAARTFLESQGYTTVSVSTNWGLTDSLASDVYPRPFPLALSDFEQYLLRNSPLSLLAPAIQDIASVSTFETHRVTVDAAFRALADLPSVQGPKFVFVHIVSPHPPFVFDEVGNPLNPPVGFSFNDANDFYGSSEEYKKGYIAQIQFVNSRVQTAVDSILAGSITPPIILIQADHGSGLLTDFSSLDNTCIRERFSPFAAYYLPGKNLDVIPSNITPVNLFRIIFNQYFYTDLPLLENRHYYFADTVFIYQPVDIASRIDESCIAP